MTTWSLTPFFNELAVLEIRLATLDPVVDVHVLAESNVTYSGVPKPYYFEEHRERFAPWIDKIRYVKVDDSPDGDYTEQPWRDLEPSKTAAWERENHQRQSLERGLDGLHDDDLILLSDLDEIPRPDAFEHLPSLGDGRLMRPRLALHVMYVNWRWLDTIPVIARFMRGKTLRRYGGPQAARLQVGTAYGPTRGAGLGWHLSYLGGVEAIRHKLESAAHHEINRPPYNTIDHITRCMASGDDLFGRPERRAEYVDYGELPPYLIENRERFAHLFFPIGEEEEVA